MTALRELGHAGGYGMVLLLPLLLLVSASANEPYLVFGTVMLVFPLARVAFGSIAPGTPSPVLARFSAALEFLPIIYFWMLAFVLGALLFTWRTQAGTLSMSASLGWALSLWLVLIFSTCVAHALLHSPSRGQRRLGHVLSGLAGYPVLGYEHVRHHRLSGNTKAAEWPRVDESVWGFAARRLRAIAAETLALDGLAVKGDSRLPNVRGLRLALVSMAATAGVFTLAAGAIGVAIYIVSSALVVFGVQLVTYLQHWGLGDDHLDDALECGYSWDSDCRFQAWVTMGLSLHQAHHRRAELAYYQGQLAEASPRHPAGYVLLMLAAFVPDVWRRLMGPALNLWIASPHLQPSAGRRLTCIAYYKS